MPVMDGVEACKRIRAWSKDQDHRPWIIALTANTFREDIDSYGAAGFDDYVSKPLSKTALRKTLDQYARRQGCYQQRGAPQNHSAQDCPSNNVNWGVIDEYLDLGIDLLGEQFTKLQANMGRCLKALQAAIDEHQQQAAMDSAHKARGIGLGYGMEGCAQQLVAVEQAAKDEDWPRCTELSESIAPLFADSLQEVQTYLENQRTDAEPVAQ